MTTNDMPYLPGDFYYSDVMMGYGPPSNIDPLLQSISPSPPSWGSVGQYLKDPQRTAIFNAPNNTQTISQDSYQTQAAVGIPTNAPQRQVRFSSPISSHELSYPTALSPPGETEASLFDFDSPPTPPDTTVSFTHYTRPNHCDPWSTHAHDLQFNNMGPLPYVNPAEVNHCQQPEPYEVEPDNFVLDRTPSRTPSWDTYQPVPAPATVVVPSHQARVTTGMPPPIKQELACNYPEPPSSDVNEHRNDSDDEPTVSASAKRRMPDTHTERKPSAKKLKPNSPPRTTTRPTAKTGANSSSPARRGRKTTTTTPNPSQPPYRLANDPNKGHFLCREPGCSPKPYTDQSSLDAHTKKKHTRPFKCVFHFAGCRSQFAAKNEWKRHVATQHLLLHYWICQEAECARLANGPSPIATNSLSSRTAGSSRSAHRNTGEENLPNGNIFNRKDLYTQHLRRMHMPKKDAGAEGKKTNSAEWDARLRALQDAAVRTRCALPEEMTCPAPGCGEEFHGAGAWDARMEHVARHLDPAAARGVAGGVGVEFGGEGDGCLVEWAGREDVKIIERGPGGVGWVLSVGCGGGGGDHQGAGKRETVGRRRRGATTIVVGGGEEEDAEGEDDF